MPNYGAGLKALSAIKAIFPGAILAGGYLRDVYFGRTPKDIDIFIPHSNWPLGHEYTLKPLIGAEYMAPNEVAHVWNVDGFELPVQIIMLQPGHLPEIRIGEHDFGFCQIWHDGWFLRQTDAFFAAVQASAAILEHCEDLKQFKRSMRRWQRLKVKYPDFRLVIPKRYQHYLELYEQQA